MVPPFRGQILFGIRSLPLSIVSFYGLVLRVGLIPKIGWRVLVLPLAVDFVIGSRNLRGTCSLIALSVSVLISGRLSDPGLHRAMSTLESGVKWLKKESKGGSWRQKAKRVAFASTVYHIWKARNKQIFEGLHPSEQGIIRQIKYHVYSVIFGHFPHVLDF